MGCASSAPLVEQGKHLVEGVKDAASDTVNKGEKALHNATDTIKEGVSSGIDTVKETVQSAINTAEESVGSVAQKIGETFNFTSSKANELEDTKQTLSSTKDDLVGNVSESAAEVVSEAETVIVSETEHAREAFQSGTSPLFETVHSMDDEMASALKELEVHGLDDFHEKTKDLEESVIQSGTEVLEDLENDTKDHLGESVKKVEMKVEELMEDGSTVKVEEKVVEVEAKKHPEKEE
ncbi:uncharacterized protein LOC126734763 isoform X2 [Anthonomus grandis grandis]|uniref:uncharacterized protein LOC126734763 isoform X2 n=1 Tax=Anthonomus grandis grandis TaxID=2921223 RepID=UPI0021652474|nr:uncharacterized protein LOC126734763 isoform X2 [Anthonomus grandis grandis]